jgi:hypothetical protein
VARSAGSPASRASRRILRSCDSFILRKVRGDLSPC